MSDVCDNDIGSGVQEESSTYRCPTPAPPGQCESSDDSDSDESTPPTTEWIQLTMNSLYATALLLYAKTVQSETMTLSAYCII